MSKTTHIAWIITIAIVLLIVAISLWSHHRSSGKSGGDSSMIGRSTDEPTNDPEVTPGQGFGLPDEVLDTYTRAALDGNETAAFRVYLYYNFTRAARAESDYWAQIAAENGSWRGMSVTAQRLMQSREPSNCRRALYWIKKLRAVEALNPVDEERARTIESIEVQFPIDCSTVTEEHISPEIRELYGGLLVLHG